MFKTELPLHTCEVSPCCDYPTELSVEAILPQATVPLWSPITSPLPRRGARRAGAGRSIGLCRATKATAAHRGESSLQM